MINNRKYTESEIKLIMNNVILVYDSREKSNSHILDWCSYKNRVETIKDKLDYGDYTFRVKAIPELGIPHTLDFRNEIVYERKNSWNEVSQNLTSGRDRFKIELAMCTAQMTIAVEDNWSNLYQGNYDTKYNRKSFIASVKTFEHRYGVSFKCFKKEEMAVEMYTSFLYYLRERLK